MLIEGFDVYSRRALKIHIEKGIVSGIEETKAKRDMPFLSQGFLDIQVNGYKGIDYSTEGLSVKKIRALIQCLARAGTTCHFPTIVTNDQKSILRNLKIIADAAADPFCAAAIPGIHLEGPYISGENGPRGAHDIRHVRNPSIKEFDEWMEASGGLIKIVTLAPEQQGALSFIREISKRGVIAAIGHSAASPEIIRKAVRAGAKLSTHLGNGSHGLIPRLKNYIWEQLAADSLYASIIADGFHLPQSAVKVFMRAKGMDKLILVSDAAFLGGSKPGIYKWGNIDVEVFPDQHLGLAGTEFLAGAGHLQNWDICRFAGMTGMPAEDVIPLVTTNPARLTGLLGTGQPYPVGEAANICVFNRKDKRGSLDIEAVYFHGKKIVRNRIE
ncbi:amidohydrolase family protein [Treponema sp. OttesenSCG-928-L16]|nr:amidohydrolase family protein [Treponema sp. OttesenSCG-928-L16]